MDDYYVIFGISQDATKAQIKARYRFLAHAYHPDKFASDSHKEFAEESFKKINEAFQTLSNPRLRADYDRKRKRNSEGAPNSSPRTAPLRSKPRPQKESDLDLDSDWDSDLDSDLYSEPPPRRVRKPFLTRPVVVRVLGILSRRRVWGVVLLIAGGIGLWMFSAGSTSSPVLEPAQPLAPEVAKSPDPTAKPAVGLDENAGDTSVSAINKGVIDLAMKGHAMSQEYLGRCYATGKGGVVRDLETSAKWYRKAAEQGEVKSEYALGECYYNEKGVSRDFAQAYKWLSLALNQGDLEPEKTENAKRILSKLQITMSPDEMAKAQQLVHQFNRTQ